MFLTVPPTAPCATEFPKKRADRLLSMWWCCDFSGSTISVTAALVNGRLWDGTHVGLSMVRHAASTTVDPGLPPKSSKEECIGENSADTRGSRACCSPLTRGPRVQHPALIATSAMGEAYLPLKDRQQRLMNTRSAGSRCRAVSRNICQHLGTG